MKQIIAISFSFFLLMTMSDWVSFAHFCEGTIKSISFFPQETCEMEGMDATCHLEDKSDDCCQTEAKTTHKTCGAMTEGHGDCCENIPLLIENNHSIIFYPIKELPVVFTISLPNLQLTYNSTAVESTTIQVNTRPPPKSLPLYIQFQRLMFYA